MNPDEIKKELRSCLGSDVIYKDPTFPNIYYTQGVKKMAQLCSAHWLITDIILHTRRLRQFNPFISINLNKEEDDDTCILSFTDGNKRKLSKKSYSFTDFPLSDTIQRNMGDIHITYPAINLWLVDNILMLPSEY